MDVPVGKRVEEFKRFIGKIPPAYRRDLHLIPVVANGKRPDVPTGTSTTSVRLTLEEAAQRLENGGNVGIMFHAPTVPIFAVDIDKDELTDDEVDALRNAFPRTLTVRTPHGGYHLYYMSTLLPRIGNAIFDWNDKRAGEIRAQNYYVLAPGSVVDGVMYTIVDDATLHAITTEEFPDIHLRKKDVPRIASRVDPSSLSVEGFDPAKYVIPNTAWTFENLLKHHGVLATLLSISPDLEPPFYVLDKYYPSQSEVDAAILSILAYYGVPEEDAYRILKAYRYRKKLDREDYLPRTWAKVSDKFAAAQLVYPPDLPLPTLELAKKLESIASERAKDYPVWQDILKVLPQDHFITRYVNVARTITDAYPEYHIGAALFALSVVAGPDLVFDYPAKEDPRLYLVVIGRPAISHKSTAITRILGRMVLSKTQLVQYHGAAEFSTEGLVVSLEAQPRQYFIYDEVSRLFKLIGKAYASDVEELLLSFFNRLDGPYVRRLASKKHVITNPWVSIIGATTPSNFENTFGEQRVRSGLFSRMLFIAPDYEKEEKPAPVVSDEARAELQRLREWLENIYERLQSIVGLQHGEPIVVKFATDGALESAYFWRLERTEALRRITYSDDILDSLLDMLSRYQEYLLRLAVLVRLGRRETLSTLAAIEASIRGEGVEAFLDTRNLLVTKEDVDIARVLMDKMFYRYATKLLQVSLASVQDSNVEKVFRLLQNMGGVATHSELLRRSHLQKDEFARVIATLEDRQDIVVETTGRGKRYWLRSVWLEASKDVGEDGNS